VFHRLSEADIARIVEIQVAQLRERLSERGLGLDLTDAALAWIAHAGYDPDYGARPLKRVLQKQLADPIAMGLLSGSYGDGDTIVVDATPDGGLTFDSAAAAELVG
jgi:ATP-dependent Clp protease ATP-binding subunit ClpB